MATEDLGEWGKFLRKAINTVDADVPEIRLENASEDELPIDCERIFVLDKRNELLSEFVLNDDCVLEFEDLKPWIHRDGLPHGVSVFRGAHVLTPFVVDDFKFVLVTRGRPRIEDRGFVASLLAAARIHFRGP